MIKFQRFTDSSYNQVSTKWLGPSQPDTGETIRIEYRERESRERIERENQEREQMPRKFQTFKINKELRLFQIN